MKHVQFEEPVAIRIDTNCRHCRDALRRILKEKRGLLFITPDFNASGRVTHHHIESRELSDDEVKVFERRLEFAKKGDVFCKTCDGKCQLS